jgi:protein-S-isoprenylcysteine O-methyltransferase Ste14
MKKLVAWLGGALFVGSLALVAWWYLWRAGRYDSGGGVRALAIDAALITLFAGHHSALARNSVKRRIVFLPAVMVRSVYVWVASLLLAAVPLFWVPIGGVAYHLRGGAAWLFAGIQIAGLWLTSRAAAGLDPLELAGIREVIGPPERSRPQSLQVTGPYRIVRHPLYLGWSLMFFGAAHMTVDRLAFATLTMAYLVVAVPWEERSLQQSFGDDYVRYTQRVRWRIVPYLY